MNIPTSLFVPEHLCYTQPSYAHHQCLYHGKLVQNAERQQGELTYTCIALTLNMLASLKLCSVAISKALQVFSPFSFIFFFFPRPESFFFIHTTGVLIWIEYCCWVSPCFKFADICCFEVYYWNKLTFLIKCLVFSFLSDSCCHAVVFIPFEFLPFC